jgi:hypothetical protein
LTPVHTLWPFFAKTGVLQHGEGHPAVVGARLGVLQDRGHLLEVLRPEEKRRVAHRLAREQRQRLRLDLEDLLPVEARDGDVPVRDLTEAGLILGDGERVLVNELRHHPPPSSRDPGDSALRDREVI